MNPSDSRPGPLHFRCLICSGWWSPHPAERVSSTGQSIFHSMPSLLPRESTRATSVVRARVQRPSPFDHRVGVSGSFTRLLIGSLALRPATLRCGNSRPRITPAPLPHATKAYGQLLGRDFNPLDSLLLLRTVRSLLKHREKSRVTASAELKNVWVRGRGKARGRRMQAEGTEKKAKRRAGDWVNRRKPETCLPLEGLLACVYIECTLRGSSWAQQR